MTRVLFLVALCVVTACGGKDASPTSPGSSTPPPPVVVTPQTFALTGFIKAQTGVAVLGATVTVLDGVHAGQATTVTNGDGTYTLPNLSGNLNVAARAAGYQEQHAGANPLTTTRSFTMRTVAPWTINGQGNTVFTMPTYFSRVRIQGTWNRTSTSNFIVRIGGSLVLNEILRDSITYDGIHLTNGGIVEIVSSTQIAWTFTEVR